MKLEAKNVGFFYNRGQWILKGVNFSVDKGERVALLGPSGYGKSTLSKILSGYEYPEEGEVLCGGKKLPSKGYCPVQLIYQHPERAVNPMMKMRDILNEGWNPDRDTMDAMGIKESWLDRYPSELSGGELQRFCITRVLSPETQFLICDEMSTMLDVINQTLIWKLLLNFVEQRNLGLIVVTHNYSLAERICTKKVNLSDINNI